MVPPGTNGLYAELGRRIRQARRDQRMTRKQLVNLVLIHQTLGVTRAGVSLMLSEVEHDGLVMNADVVKRITSILGISHP